MNSKKRGQKGRPAPRGTGFGDDSDDFIDASPEQDGKDLKHPPNVRNLQETKIYKDATGGVRAMWANYVSFLGRRFADTPRKGQEQFIMRMSQTLTIGSAILITSLFYPFLPTMIRVVLLPGVLVLSWWLGTKVVAQQMTIRFEKYLNQEY